MPTATRTFRVFVSSTYEDLKVERDTLAARRFPQAAQALRSEQRAISCHRLALALAR